MEKITFTRIFKTSIVTALTVAVAFIWRDVILNIIHYFFPSNGVVYYELIIAIIATIFAVILIYFVLKTEFEAEKVFKKFRKK
ncbi:MAG: DUF5654 family protein [archaeon]